jgi:hypothetical protein
VTRNRASGGVANFRRLRTPSIRASGGCGSRSHLGLLGRLFDRRLLVGVLPVPRVRVVVEGVLHD